MENSKAPIGPCMHFLTVAPNEVEWSFEENKLFENALTEADDLNSSPQLFEKIAMKVPAKTVEEIEKHYEAIVEDVENIEAGKIPLPEYNNRQAEVVPRNRKMEKKKKKKETTSSVGKKRRLTWTEEEHKQFMMGFEKHGRGRWKTISDEYVNSKTPTQVATHARRFFQRLHNRQSTANNIIKTTATDHSSQSLKYLSQIPENQTSNSHLPSHLRPSSNNINIAADEQDFLDWDKFPSIYD